jgi:hypothetical protein
MNEKRLKKLIASIIAVTILISVGLIVALLLTNQFLNV